MQTRSVADKASLSGLRRSIRGDLTRAGVDPARAFDCLVAVTEACTRALLKDAAGASQAPDIAWEVDTGWVRFYIHEKCTRKSAKACHPSGGGHLAPLAPEAFEDLPVRLMEALMDEVVVSEGPGGRTTTLTKQLQ